MSSQCLHLSSGDITDDDPANVYRTLRLKRTKSTGKRAFSLLLEKYLGGRSPKTIMLDTYHVLIGSNNNGLLTWRRTKNPFSEPSIHNQYT